MDKDPAEQEMLARGIGNELTEIFVRYVHGEVDFAEATFAAYDVLEDLHVIASGDYELEEDGDIEDEYTEEERDGAAGGALPGTGARLVARSVLSPSSSGADSDGQPGRVASRMRRASCPGAARCTVLLSAS